MNGAPACVHVLLFFNSTVVLIDVGYCFVVQVSITFPG